MSSVPTISVLLLTKNGTEYLEEVLRAIFSQKLSETFEVIAIDSGSTDGTLDMLRRYPVRVREIAPEEFNHGRTRNLGIAMAHGDFVVLITQDATPSTESWLERMLANFSDPDVAGVYCRQIPRPDAGVLTKRQLNGWVTARPHREIKRITDWQRYGSLPPMEQYMFCAFDNVSSCIRKEVWRKHLFPYTSFAEDLEWSKRVLEEGHAIVYEPEAAVFHSHHRSVLYEYQRTYLCHRRLYELFRLHTIPTPRHAARAILRGVLEDLRFVIRNERPLPKTLRLLCRLPLRVTASVLGQYRGARDESRQLPRKTFRKV
jgi:rhamnosyltransferase